MPLFMIPITYVEDLSDLDAMFYIFSFPLVKAWNHLLTGR